MSTELFDEAVRTYLGCSRIDPATCSGEAADCIGWLRKTGERLIADMRIGNPKLPSIHLDFANADEPNAFAFLHKGQRFIGVTAGAAIGMTMLFKRMLSDRRILTHVGNPQEEVEHPPLARPMLSSLLQDLHKNGALPVPKGDRQEFWEFLAQTAFMFLILHELTHIRNGHVDYLTAGGSPFLSELGGGSVNPDESIRRQALEVDADVGAAGFASSFMSQLRRDPPFRCPHLQNYDSRLCGLSIAVFSFFRVFTDEPLAGADLCKTKHPPHRFRFSAIMGAIPSGAKAAGGITTENAQRAFARGLRHTEQAFHILTGEPMPEATNPDQFLYTEAYGQVGMQHKERLKKCWNEGLRKELEPYAYGSPMTYED
jgi:hypothetical protein